MYKILKDRRDWRKTFSNVTQNGNKNNSNNEFMKEKIQTLRHVKIQHTQKFPYLI